MLKILLFLIIMSTNLCAKNFDFSKGILTSNNESLMLHISAGYIIPDMALQFEKYTGLYKKDKYRLLPLSMGILACVVKEYIIDDHVDIDDLKWTAIGSCLHYTIHF